MNNEIININKPLILASKSPQRANILRMIDIPFVIVPSSKEETLPDNYEDLRPEQIAEYFAKQKAFAVKDKYSNSVILGVDTLVVSNQGKILGKPKDIKEAKEMILEKSDSKEEIISGVTVIYKDKVITKHEKSYVYFSEILEKDADEILAFNEWQGRSGGFSVEGKTNLYIKKIEGDFYNIVGLPIYLFRKILEQLCK